MHTTLCSAFTRWQHSHLIGPDRWPCDAFWEELTSAALDQYQWNMAATLFTGGFFPWSILTVWYIFWLIHTCTLVVLHLWYIHLRWYSGAQNVQNNILAGNHPVEQKVEKWSIMQCIAAFFGALWEVIKHKSQVRISLLILHNYVEYGFGIWNTFHYQ